MEKYRSSRLTGTIWVAEDWFLCASDASYYDDLRNNSPWMAFCPAEPWSVQSCGESFSGRVYAQPGYRITSGKGKDLITLWPLPTTCLALALRDVCGDQVQVFDRFIGRPGIHALIESFDELKAGRWHGDLRESIDKITKLISSLVPERPEIDPRARLLADRLRQDTTRNMGMFQHGKAVGLSADRLRHLFMDAYGLRVSQFLAWLKMHSALRFAAQGATKLTITDLAAAAGFSDASHLANMARRMFATKPSETQGHDFRYVLLSEGLETTS